MLGLFVSFGERTGYAYTESLTLDAIQDATESNAGWRAVAGFHAQIISGATGDARYEMKTAWADSTVESELNAIKSTLSV